jgi:hypothetical protein
MFVKAPWDAKVVTFIDRPLPADLDLPAIVPLKHGRGNPPRKPKGATAKVTRDLKQGIIDAAANIGRDGEGTDGLTGYLEDLALHHKRAFAGLLVKILPMQVNANATNSSVVSISVQSVPSGMFFTPEAIAQMNSDEPVQLEHQPQAQPMLSAPQPSEEAAEAEIIEKLRAEINDLARQKGLSLVV